MEAGPPDYYELPLLVLCYVGSWVSVILAIVAIVTGIVGAAVFLARLLVIEF